MMGNDTTDPEYAARKWLSDCGNEDQADTVLGLLDELDALRERLAEQGAAEVTTEWAARWPATADQPDPLHEDLHEGYGADRVAAARVARQFRGEGVELVSCTVRTVRSPWTPAVTS